MSAPAGISRTASTIWMPAVNGIAEGILQELQEYAAESKPGGEACGGDKLPHNFENIGLIKFLFPNARIISVRRDPRDIAISNYFTDYAATGHGFCPRPELDRRTAGGPQPVAGNYWQKIPGQILEVQYEEVVSNTEATARKMLDYIGVPWEPQVLNFSELDRPVKTASVWQVRQPIYTTSTSSGSGMKPTWPR